jgi:hypothetical protein
MRRTAPFRSPFPTVVALGTGLFLAACTVLPNPNPPVPPLQAETMPLPPVTATPLIWRPGHWDWTGAGYAWQPGVFVPRGEHSDQWMPGFWALTGGSWVWQPAHWL